MIAMQQGNTPNDAEDHAVDQSADVGSRVIASRSTLERLLRDNLLPFWTRRAIDREAGGYRLNHDPTGRDLGPHSRTLIAQARTLWFFARLAASPYGTPEHRDLATHGFAFLRDTMRDDAHGGFFGEVDTRGTPVRTDKHLYEQSFALYAMSAYHRLTHDTDALAFANGLVEHMTRAADTDRGGFHETFDRQWRPIDDGPLNVLGVPPTTRTINTHLHLLESLTAYHAVAPDDRVAPLVCNLIDLLAFRLPDPQTGITFDEYRPDWTLDTRKGPQSVSYGHGVETAWLLLEAADAVGKTHQPIEPVLDQARRVVTWCCRHGLDRRRGGFYSTGPLHPGPLDALRGWNSGRRDKVWWVQAEALFACLRLFHATDDPMFAEAYLSTLGWIDRHQADHDHGGWHGIVSPRGKPRPRAKANAWKTPYHNGRALLECLALL